MDAQEKRQVRTELRALRDAMESIHIAAGQGLPDAKLLERYTSVTAKGVGVLDAAILALAT